MDGDTGLLPFGDGPCLVRGPRSQAAGCRIRPPRRPLRVQRSSEPHGRSSRWGRELQRDGFPLNR